jgi:glycerol-3-phosphate dehydrogenase
VVHLDDLMLRRTRLGLLLENGGDEILSDIHGIVTEVRGWSEDRWQSELSRYRSVIEKYYTVPVNR